MVRGITREIPGFVGVFDQIEQAYGRSRSHQFVGAIIRDGGPDTTEEELIPAVEEHLMRTHFGKVILPMALLPP